ncbi:EF hand domain-containing protein, partial [Pseudomonas sp. CF161]
FHGGIHFDRGTANVFSTEEGVQCVADGEIVAYRIDEHYPDATPVADTPLEASAEPLANAGDAQEAQATAVLRPYSTGFVLVRHRLQAPPLPAPASDDALAPATTEPDYGTRLATRAHGPSVGWLPLYARVALLELQNDWAKVRILPPSVATWTHQPVAEPWLPLYSLDRL